MEQVYCFWHCPRIKIPAVRNTAGQVRPVYYFLQFRHNENSTRSVAKSSPGHGKRKMSIER